MTLLDDLLICLRFFSRLPVPTTERERALGAAGLAEAAAVIPVAGATLALFPAAALLAARWLHLSAAVASILAIAVAVAVTGALHEDAAADCADGFGGGRTRDRKLEIMRDSRIGAFGAATIVLSLVLRVAALEGILAEGLGPAVGALIVAATLSRTACLLPLAILPPARADGAGANAARPDARRVAAAAAIAVALAIGTGWLAPSRHVLGAVLFVVLAALAFCALAHRQIGGQTGDVAGAVQQATEIAVLVTLSAG